MTSGTQTALPTVSDAICEQYGPLAVRYTKVHIERSAQAAQARGLSPNEACPHPFHSKCGMHWLAAFNLSIPLPSSYHTSKIKSLHKHVKREQSAAQRASEEARAI